jgi:hypothetical protein
LESTDADEVSERPDCRIIGRTGRAHLDTRFITCGGEATTKLIGRVGLWECGQVHRV